MKRFAFRFPNKCYLCLIMSIKSSFTSQPSLIQQILAVKARTKRRSESRRLIIKFSFNIKRVFRFLPLDKNQSSIYSIIPYFAMLENGKTWWLGIKFGTLWTEKREIKTPSVVHTQKENEWKWNLLVVPISRSIELQIYLMHPSSWGFAPNQSQPLTPANIFENTGSKIFPDFHQTINLCSTVILQHQFIYLCCLCCFVVAHSVHSHRF